MAGLLGRLWAQPPGAYLFRPLAQMCAVWAEEFEQDYAAAPVADRIDPGLAWAGIMLFRHLPQTADRQVLLCTDLHGDNILAAQREPWLVIDPQALCRRPRLRPTAAHAQLRGETGRRPSRAGRPDGGPRRDRRPPGLAMAVRAERAGVDRLTAHASGGHAARARIVCLVTSQAAL